MISLLLWFICIFWGLGIVLFIVLYDFEYIAFDDFFIGAILSLVSLGFILSILGWFLLFEND